MTRSAAASTLVGGHVGNADLLLPPKVSPPPIERGDRPAVNDNQANHPQASYLDSLGDEGSLSPELAELAEVEDDGPFRRPLMRHERDRLNAAIYLCAVRIRRARPAAVRAALEGRIEYGE